MLSKQKQRQPLGQRNSNSIISTPSFIKKDSNFQGNSDCDFDDDMIDENADVHHILSMVSPLATTRHLDSIDEDEEMRMLINSGVAEGFTFDKENVDWEFEGKAQVQSKQIQFNAKVNPKKSPSVPQDKKPTKKAPIKSQNIELNKKIKDAVSSAAYQKPKELKGTIATNIDDFINKKQKKLQQLRLQQQSRQMKECTFAPKTTTNKDRSITPRRKLQQFIQSQEQFANRVQQKNIQMKLQQEKKKTAETSFTPVINKSSKSSEKANKCKPAYERLYELKSNRSKFQTEHDENMNEGKLFVPVTGPKLQATKPLKLITQSKSGLNFSSDNHSRGELLYEDALRRSNFKKSVAKNHPTNNNVYNSGGVEMQCAPNTPKTNKNTQKFVAHKLIKEYCIALQKLSLLPDDTDENESFKNMDKLEAFEFTHREKSSISFDVQGEIRLKDFQSILRELGFLIYEEQDNSDLAFKERSLAQEAYQLLQNSGVNIKNTCVLLLAFIGIYNVEPINFTSQQSLSEKSTNFDLDEKEGKKIHQYFDLLYRNRLTSCKKIKSTNNNNNRSQASPDPNQKSANKRKEYTEYLANRHRERMIEKTNERFMSNHIDIVIPSSNVLNHEDMLVINSIGKNLDLENQRRQKASKQLTKEYTFHPKVNQVSAGLMEYLEQPNEEEKIQRGMQKSQQLYQYAKMKKQMIGNRRNPVQQLHHPQPNLQRSKGEQRKNKNKGGQLTQHVKNVQKTLARMHQARKARQEKEQFLKRGELSQQPKPKKRSKFENHTSRGTNKNNNKHCQSVATHTQQTEQSLWRPATDRIYEEELRSYFGFNDSLSPRYEQPFLVVDVNMENETQQIEFYTGDEQRIEFIVDQFCLKHGLDLISKNQLLELVEREMTNFLNVIGIESTTEV